MGMFNQAQFVIASAKCRRGTVHHVCETEGGVKELN